MAEKKSSQPKIAQKMAIRTLVLVVVLGAMYQGFQYFQAVRSDIGGLKSSDTDGMISAVEFANDGSKVVVISPKGDVSTTSGWKEGVVDRDQVWAPDGNFLYFCSDRKDHSFHIFRWSPGSGDAEQRSIAKSGRSHPFFAADLPAAENPSMMLIAGGVVRGFNPKDSSAPQFLPPLGAEVVQTNQDEGGSGTEGAFAAAYGQIGTSFKIAKWMKQKKFIAAVMGRDSGEVLVVQDMTPKEGKLPTPNLVAAGEHIDIDVSPADGSLIYSVQDFRWPQQNQIPEQFRKGGKITTPFRHVVGLFDPESKDKIGPILRSNDDKVAFGTPSVSPDGTTLLVSAGPYDASSGLKPDLLFAAPVRVASEQAGSILARGEIYEPSWSPRGDYLVFARRANGKRDIITVSKTGGEEKNITNGKGNFGWPKFSPQIKAPK